jgi:enoyl-CoA hydratase
MFQTLVVSVRDHIAFVIINRPDALNALTPQVLDELGLVFEQLGHNDEVGVIILTGAGEKSFCAGAEVDLVRDLDAERGVEFSRKGQHVFNMIEQSTKPVIAAINGFALGAGCELAMACHIRIASDYAKFGLPKVAVGFIPSFGGTQRLSRLVGRGKALEIILTGELIDAQEACRIGLVSRMVVRSDILAAAEKFAERILAKNRMSIRFAIESINAADRLPLDKGLETEAQLFGACCASEEIRNGTRAFMETRRSVLTNKT